MLPYSFDAQIDAIRVKQAAYAALGSAASTATRRTSFANFSVSPDPDPYPEFKLPDAR